MSLILFHKQALDNHINKAQGVIIIAPCISYNIITILIVVFFILFLLWSSLATYSRKETVAGWLEPKEGLVRLYSEKSGVIDKILISEGAIVHKGQSLIVVSDEKFLSNGEHLDVLLKNELLEQKLALEKELEQTKNIYEQKNLDLSERIQSTTLELSLLNEQEQSIHGRIELISNQEKRYKELKDKGFVSENLYDSLITNHLTLNGEVKTIQRSSVNLKDQLAQLKNQINLNSKLLEHETNAINSRIRDVNQQIIKTNADNVYTIKAPYDGVVNNLQVNVGQHLNPNFALLSIIPEKTSLVVNLLVPEKAIGFIKRNQSVRIRYDSFPYQKFGVSKANVLTVANASVLPQEIPGAPIKPKEPVYIIKAVLEHQFVHVYTMDTPLRSGMTLSADIITQNKTLLHWILDPIFSAKDIL